METVIRLNNNRDLQLLFGKYDQNLKLIEQELDIKMTRQGDGLKLSGSEEQVKKASGLMDYLLSIVDSGKDIKKRDIVYALRLSSADKGIDFKLLAKEKIEVSAKGAVVTPKTKGQIEYIEAIKHYDLVFGLGPAGTGKTYLAMAMAVSGDDSEAKSSGTKGSSQKQIDLLQIMLEQLTKLSKEESKSSTSLLDVTA